MWLFTPFGYFSIVEKPQDRGQETLTVRARFAGDLDALKARHLPELSAIAFSNDNDYAYRAQAPRAAVARAMGEIVLALDYTNFKNEVTRVQGHERHNLYSRVWSVLEGAQRAIVGARHQRRQGTPPKRERQRARQDEIPGWASWQPVRDWNDDF